MVIVWRLRGNVIGTFLYCQHAIHFQRAQLTKTVYSLSFSFNVFRLHDLSVYFWISFVLPWSASFPIMFSRCHITNLNESPQSFYSFLITAVMS